jgi:hypothetical protein
MVLFFGPCHGFADLVLIHSPLVTEPRGRAAAADRIQEIAQKSAAILRIEPEDDACLTRKH